MLQLDEIDLNYIDNLIDRIESVNDTLENAIIDKTIKELREKLKLKTGLKRHTYTCSNCGRQLTSWQNLDGSIHDYCPEGRGYWTK